jgi:hypothetical protein
VEEIRVETWAELHGRLFADARNESLGPHRSDFASAAEDNKLDQANITERVLFPGSTV